MMPLFKSILLYFLSYFLLCSASILPKRAHSHTHQAEYYALTLLVANRQQITCFSKDECAESEVCVQLDGELVCEEDCDGLCVPKSNVNRFCNCDIPCEDGFCTLPFPDTPTENGLCSLNPDGSTALECPGSDGSSDPATPEPSAEPSTSDGSEDSGNRKPDKDREKNPQGSESQSAKPGSDSHNGSEPDNADSGSDNDESDPDNSESEPDSAGSESANMESETDEDKDTTSENSEEPTDGVCIGADMLGKFGSHELVFPRHVLSQVLCDASGSCATKGHIVKYEGRGMMMSSYCGIVGCTKKVMYVNSPKYQRGLRVGSRSKNMEFTSFAARYATLGEEVALRMAVRLGL